MKAYHICWDEESAVVVAESMEAALKKWRRWMEANDDEERPWDTTLIDPEAVIEIEGEVIL